MTPQTIISKDPADLRPDPFVKSLPRWGEKSDEFKGFRADIRANGIIEPLKITSDGRVLDGETRRLAARALQMDSVPCIVVPDDQANETMLRALVRRRPLMKSQMAFLAAPLIPVAFVSYRRRGSQYFDSRIRGEAVNTSIPNHLGRSIDSEAEYERLMGFSGELMRQARELWTWIEKCPEEHEFGRAGKTETMTLKDFVYKTMFDGDNPLGLAGIKKLAGQYVSYWKESGKKTGGVPTALHKQLNLFGDPLDDTIGRWCYWSEFDEATKLAHFETVRGKLSTLPPAQLDEMAEYYELLAKEFRKTAKMVKAQVAA
jgi:hypothetical protein